MEDATEAAGLPPRAVKTKRGRETPLKETSPAAGASPGAGGSGDGAGLGLRGVRGRGAAPASWRGRLLSKWRPGGMAPKSCAWTATARVAARTERIMGPG